MLALQCFYMEPHGERLDSTDANPGLLFLRRKFPTVTFISMVGHPDLPGAHII